MSNLRIIRIPILERVVLEDLATKWHVTADQAVVKLIRQAAKKEVLELDTAHIASEGLSDE